MRHRKYEFTGETIAVDGRILHRIRALRDIAPFGIRAGDTGGFIESEANLSHKGDCWIRHDACVYENARIQEKALISHEARICGKARVYGKASIAGKALVRDNACVFDEARVLEFASISGNALVFGEACVRGNCNISECCLIHESAHVLGNASVQGKSRISGDALITGNVTVLENAVVSGAAYLDGNAFVRKDACIFDSMHSFCFGPISYRGEMGYATCFRTKGGKASISHGASFWDLEAFEESMKDEQGGWFHIKECQMLTEMARNRVEEWSRYNDNEIEQKIMAHDSESHASLLSKMNQMRQRLSEGRDAQFCFVYVARHASTGFNESFQ